MPMAIEPLQWIGVDYLLSPDRRLYWGYLLLALVIGLLAARLNGQGQRAWLGGHIWWHPSARLDYGFFIVSAAIKFGLIMPLLWNAGDIAVHLLRFLDAALGYRPKLGRAGGGVMLAYGLMLFLANDLTRYLLHRLMHRVPALWAIHRVHHSAQVLTPFTFYRMHPLENLLFGLRYALASGLVSAIFIYLFGAAIGLPQIFGVNAFVLVAHLLGDNLRHSHLRLRYPGWLQHLLIAPQQHQFHHDVNGGRCNYGSVLALWDWLFRSLHVCRANERYVFGVAGNSAPRSISELLLMPLQGRRRVARRPALMALSTFVLLAWLAPLAASVDQARIELGRQLFFDPRLSLQGSQSCASCHDPAKGFVEARDSGVGAAASLGDDGVSLGDRNTPTLGYAALAPAFHFDAESKQYQGGMFWDGRAVDLADQAAQPILNPLEMAMPDQAAVVARISADEHYRVAFQEAFGSDVFADTGRAYAAIAAAIAAFERTPEFSPFDSKYDRYLSGDYELSDLEDLGMSIFFSTTNSNCSNCHQLKVMDAAGDPFTNYQYHNIGTPANASLRRRNAVPPARRDTGLAANPLVAEANLQGRFKVPSLRNVAITGPYMHNGVFAELRTVIEFYDQYNNPERSINPETGRPWDNAEIPETVEFDELKAKKLDDRRIDALIAFLRTLTDRRYEALLQ